MSTLNGIPYAGPTEFSLDDCKDELIDLPPTALRYLRTAKPGIEKVRVELTQTIPVHGETAGVSSTMFDQFVADTLLIDKLRAHEMVLAKALEVVRETLAQKENDRENTLSHIADRVKSTAQRTRNPAVLAAFEKTLQYNSQSALKGVETRRKKAQSKKTAEKVG